MEKLYGELVMCFMTYFIEKKTNLSRHPGLDNDRKIDGPTFGPK